MKQLEIQEPVGRIMSHISKGFLIMLHQQLTHLDIKRSYYPLLLIEAGGGTLTQNDLAQQLNCDKVQVVRIIDYLSSKGYVERVRNREDRRKYGLRITNRAKQNIPQIKEAIETATQSTLMGLTEEQKSDLLNMLYLMNKNLTSQHNEHSV